MYNVFSTREIGVLKVVNLMLTARQMLIFKCIVEEFIENAEPVGSKALMVKYQLPYSSATIRNEMNFLENYGYLEKTHISSGRVPSKEGYRFYVHNLGKVDLDEGTKNQVATIINKHRRNLNEMVHESCNMLSELTHLTSVALGNASDDMLQRISVVPLDDGRVTAIIITSQGHVENKVFQFSSDVEMEDLLSCVNVMNELLIGTPISEVAFRLERDVRPILTTQVKQHEELFNAFLEAFVKFASNSVFENSKVWKTLPLSSEDGIQINIGNETPLGKMNDVSVISASFKTGETSKGSISVIGPTRMPYEKVVALVEYISENIEKACLEDKQDEK